MNHGQKAEELFLSGYNCAQAVLSAFNDITGLTDEESVRISSGLGGGMCGKRYTCGAVSGMIVALGLIEGSTDPSDHDAKKELYAHGKALIDAFEEKCSSSVCLELLKNVKALPVPSERTPEYYKDRPCAKLCRIAGELLDAYLAAK